MSRSRLYSTHAIVLRRNDFGEADRLVTLLTPEMGKLRVLAKGARKVTSRKAGHIELFTRTQLLLAKGRTFDLITQAELIEPYRALREDVARAAQAHYLCELVESFAPEDSDSAALYDLLAEGLSWLCQASDPTLVARVFELRLLSLEGYRPELFKCARTGEPLDIDRDAAVERAPFSPSEGGVLLSAVGLMARDAYYINRSALMLLRAIQTQSFGAIDALAVSRDLHAQAERAMQTYVSYVLERRPKTPAFIHQLQADARQGR
jgi:DNA repair protein RecO (recombination protein O)